MQKNDTRAKPTTQFQKILCQTPTTSWQTHIPYDEVMYLKALERRGSTLISTK
jgi:hypothetical protein